MNEKKIAVFEIMLCFSILSLFIPGHFLSIISFKNENLFIIYIFAEFLFYGAIFLTVLLFVLIFHNNFELKEIEDSFNE